MEQFFDVNQQMVNKVIFGDFPRLNKVVFASLWYDFSKFIPRFLAGLALKSNNEFVFCRLISISNEEMGDGNISRVHSQDFNKACVESNIIISEDLKANSLKILRDVLQLDNVSDSFILGLHLGLEYVANENIEYLASCLSDYDLKKIKETNFFKIHFINEEIHIQKCLDNFQYCKNKKEQDQFHAGFNLGVEFWQQLYPEVRSYGKKLTLINAIPLGIGSIIGSGILFLPSLTYKVSENDVLISWGVIIALCLVGTVYLKRLLFSSPIYERNVAGMVKVGLGESAGNAVYVILLGTVIIGMPSAAIIAGDYLQQTFHIPYLREVSAFGIVTVALLSNLRGIGSSSIVAGVLAFGLVLVSILFIYNTTTDINFSKISPSYDIFKTYKGSVLAFWAFAGFENLTFLYDKFKNPKRDFLPTIMISIVGCGILYVLLVVNYLSVVEYSEIKTTIGLLQLTEIFKLNSLKYIITLFAFFAVLINLVSWTSGVVEMIKNISKRELLPAFPKEVSTTKSIVILGALFYSSLCLGLFFSSVFEKLLSIVSTNFLVVYAMTFLSYVIFEVNKNRKVLPLLIFMLLAAIISSSGTYLIYPLILFIVTTIRTMEKIA